MSDETNTEHPDSHEVVDYDFQDTIDFAQGRANTYNARRAKDYIRRWEQAESWYGKQPSAASKVPIKPPDPRRSIVVDFLKSSITTVYGPELVTAEFRAPWDVDPPPPPAGGTVDVGPLALRDGSLYHVGPKDTTETGHETEIGGLTFTHISGGGFAGLAEYWARADRLKLFG